MILVLLAEGFEEIEALTPVDMLRRDGREVFTVSLSSSERSVKGAHGISVEADLLISEVDADACELLLLPGGMPGTKNLATSPAVPSLLSTVWKRGGYLAAICAAPTVLAKYGYLEGRRATCFPGFESEMKGACVTDLPVVTDGRITTAKDMTEALSFSTTLLTLLSQDDAAKKILPLIEETSEDDSPLGDEVFCNAVRLVLEKKKASASYLQRALSMGYARAAKYLDTMESLGIIGEEDDAGVSKPLITEAEWCEMLARHAKKTK